MIESLEEVTLADGQRGHRLNVRFESDDEAAALFAQLRAGFPELAKKPSLRWLALHENKLEMANAFALVWTVIKLAREGSDKDFNMLWDSNHELQAAVANMASEAARLLLVLVDAAGRTKVKRLASAKDVRRRLQPTKTLLVQCAGEGFSFTPLPQFPGIMHQKKARA